MSLGLIFWILMLVWFVFGVYQHRANFNGFAAGGSLLTFILFLILGWAAFGAPIRG
jgi:hypothetical protein